MTRIVDMAALLRVTASGPRRGRVRIHHRYQDRPRHARTVTAVHPQPTLRTQQSLSSARGNTVLSWRLTLLLATHLASLVGFTPLGPYFCADWQVTPLTFALTAACYPLASALAVCARAGTYRWARITAAPCLFAAVVAASLVPDILSLCISRTIAGFAGGIVLVTCPPSALALRIALWFIPLELVIAESFGWQAALGLVSLGAVVGVAGDSTGQLPARAQPMTLYARLAPALLAFATALGGTFMSGLVLANSAVSLPQLPLVFVVAYFLRELLLKTIVTAWVPHWLQLSVMLIAHGVAMGLIATLPVGSDIRFGLVAAVFLATATARTGPVDRVFGAPDLLQHSVLFAATASGTLLAGMLVSRDVAGDFVGYSSVYIVGICAIGLAGLLCGFQRSCTEDQRRLRAYASKGQQSK